MSIATGTDADHALRTTWLVARREIRLRVNTRAYRIITAILLIAVALAVVLPAVLASKSSAPDRIGVVGADTAAVSSLVTEAGRSRSPNRAWRQRRRRCAAAR